MIENKNIKKITVIIITVLGLLLIGYFCFIKNDASPKKSHFPKKENKPKISDSINENRAENDGVYGEEMYTIPNKTLLRNDSNLSSSIIDTLSFGTKVYVKHFGYSEEDGYVDVNALLKDEKKNGYIAIYINSPKSLSQKPYGYVNEKTLVSDYEFKNFKKYFSIKEFAALESKNKRIILENNRFDSNTYYPTEDSKRAPHTIVNGDFDGDGLVDFCVALDNVKNSDSVVLIFLTNSQTKEPYLAFSKVYGDYIQLEKKNKHEVVDLNNMKENSKRTIVYDAICVKDNLFYYSLLVYDDRDNKIGQYTMEATLEY